MTTPQTLVRSVQIPQTRYDWTTLDGLRSTQDFLAAQQAQGFLNLVAERVATAFADSVKVVFTRSEATRTLTCVTPIYENGSFGQMLTLERLCDGYSDTRPPAFTFAEFHAQLDPEIVIISTSSRQQFTLEPDHDEFAVATSDLLELYANRLAFHHTEA